MIRLFFIFFLVVSMTTLLRSDDRLVRSSDPLEPEQEQAALKVSDGFEIQLFAAEPMINKPINMALDEKGRLWVSSTTEYPFAADRSRWVDEKGSRVRDSRDAIKILEDSDGDGKADRVWDFADGLNIPTGVLPWHPPEHHAGCIAWSIPNIWYFGDTDGDGKCDLREVLYGPMGYEKDTHGMCSSFRLGPDGWVYATHGFNNTSRAQGKDGHEIEMSSGNVFRFRPDGSRIEVFTRGQVNPFGLAFDRRANLYSTDCHTAPIYQLIHGAEYPHFSKPAPSIGFGPVMMEHNHGSTGICGIVLLDRGVWGADFDNHVLIGNPVTSRINHDRITFLGTTPSAEEQPDFITSSDPWFRPVDLQMGPDGALYIADFYNRIIGHYEVPLNHPGRDRERGRIWRVVKKGGASLPVPPLEPVEPDLEGDDPFQVRAAATELRLHPRTEAFLPLQAALKKFSLRDTHLHHALKLALVAHLESLPETFSLLDRGDSQILQIALAVSTEDSAQFLLDLGPGKDRERLTHIARFGSAETRRQLIDREGSKAKHGTAEEAGAVLRALVRGLEEGGAVSRDPELTRWAFNIAQELLDGPDLDGSPTWMDLGGGAAQSPWILQKRQCADGVETEVISSLRQGEPKAEQRTGILRSKRFVAPPKLELWICGHRGFPNLPAHDKNKVRLVDGESGEELLRAYPPRNDVCQPVSWDLARFEGKEVLLEIEDGDNGSAYAWIGLTRIEPPLVTVASFRDEHKTSELLPFLAEYLKVSAPAQLRDRLQPFLPPSPAPAPRQISAEETRRINALIADRITEFQSTKGNSVNGKRLFQFHCAVCHQRGGEGGLIGPQLDGIGIRGIARLTEDILDPSRNVDANFHVTSLNLSDGSVVAGFVVAERGEILLLTDAIGKTHRIHASSVSKRETSSLSLMPSSYGDLLSAVEFKDLVSWLLE